MAVNTACFAPQSVDRCALWAPLLNLLKWLVTFFPNAEKKRQSAKRIFNLRKDLQTSGIGFGRGRFHARSRFMLMCDPCSRPDMLALPVIRSEFQSNAGLQSQNQCASVLEIQSIMHCTLRGTAPVLGTRFWKSTCAVSCSPWNRGLADSSGALDFTCLPNHPVSVLDPASDPSDLASLCCNVSIYLTCLPNTLLRF